MSSGCCLCHSAIKRRLPRAFLKVSGFLISIPFVANPAHQSVAMQEKLHLTIKHRGETADNPNYSCFLAAKYLKLIFCSYLNNFRIEVN